MVECLGVWIAHAQNRFGVTTKRVLGVTTKIEEGTCDMKSLFCCVPARRECAIHVEQFTPLRDPSHTILLTSDTLHLIPCSPSSNKLSHLSSMPCSLFRQPCLNSQMEMLVDSPGGKKVFRGAFSPFSRRPPQLLGVQDTGVSRGVLRGDSPAR